MRRPSHLPTAGLWMNIPAGGMVRSLFPCLGALLSWDPGPGLQGGVQVGGAGRQRIPRSIIKLQRWERSGPAQHEFFFLEG